VFTARYGLNIYTLKLSTSRICFPTIARQFNVRFTNAPYSSLFTCWYLQEEMRAKPGNLPKSSTLAVILGSLDRKVLRLGL
jgi:hypothetical protein